MTGLKKFGTKRFEYLKRRQPKILDKLEEHGILDVHLRYAQNRADQHLNRLVMAGVEEFEAEEIVLREIIQASF